MKKSLCVVMCFTIFLAVCGGQAANPVDRYMLGDENKSCNSLKAEVVSLDEEIVLKNRSKANRDRSITLDLGKNVTMNLVLIPAGKFVMGSPSNENKRDNDEGPQREVSISRPFYMGVYEVTQDQYEAVMGNNPSKYEGATNPVERVSWKNAMEFCKNLSQKTGKIITLPTEAQWEYACRAGTQTSFYFGSNDASLGDYAWYSGNRRNNEPHPVGQKKPNAFDLYDMHGNIWEWCADWYAGSYANASTKDPSGPNTGQYRVVRGGCWGDSAGGCRSAFRLRRSPGRRYYSSGFRVVLDLN
jgi:formylglycine-generating enzyme required for sulfatase activity